MTDILKKIQALHENKNALDDGDNRKLIEIGKSNLLLFKLTKGWLTITSEEKKWHVMFTDDKDTCSSGSAHAADFDKKTGERYTEKPIKLINGDDFGGSLGAWQQAISMWPVKDENKANKIFDSIKSKINSAYQYNS